MALTKYKFGELIELCFIRNDGRVFDENSAIGVNMDKEIRIMKGDASGKDLEKFFLVKPGFFVYNPRGSRKLGLGYNDSTFTFITTYNNMIFRVKDDAKELIHPYYLFMYLRRPEWDRKAEMFSWGSSTEVFSWDTFCDMEIELPEITIQKKYVAIYKAMIANQRDYENGLEDLKLACDAFIEKLMKELPHKKIGEYLIPSEARNDLGLSADYVRGLAVSKAMIPTKANMVGVGLNNYKIVPPDYIAYVPDTSRRGDKVSMGFNDTKETYLVSSISTVFTTKKNTLLPEYLMMFFCRSEFDRYARFHSWGSARETFDWTEMCDVRIPIPKVEVQQNIVNIFTAYSLRKEINEQLKAQIQGLCPILIRGSLEEGGQK